MTLLINRRHALCCAAALGAGLFTSLVGAQTTSRWWNPCRGALPEPLANHPLVAQAFDGIDAAALWDVHVHLLGTGDSGSGCAVHPSMHEWWHPVEVVRRLSILDASCIAPDAASIDLAYVERLVRLVGDFPPGARWLLFAFDHACDEGGEPRADWSTFHVPNAYAARVAAGAPERFGWVASIHPYRTDAIERLDAALRDGALALKWLPSAMNIDLRSPRCRPFYDRLAAARLPLIVHCGEEQAVPGAGRAAFGNPLHVRAPLERGVRVIVAHAASLGGADDTDRRSRPRRAAFDLWARLMDERAHERLLLADISGALQSNRALRVARTLLERADWHPRLLHGSDHPLPGLMPLYRTERFAAAGLLEAGAVEPLDAIRAHNPLLYDFALKRHLRHGGARFSPVIFDTRRHWRA
jgi:mannonate dehydratase